MEMTPMARFVGTTELLEQMFLESDQQTLLTALQRVCCRWRDIIKTSPALQVHLFRKPAPAPPAREGLVVEPILNPLLVTKFPYFFTRVQQQTDDVDPNHPSPDDNGRTHNNDPTVFYSQEQFYRLPLAADPEPYLRPDASWRTMHVRQPPLEGLGVALPMVRYSQRHLQDVTMGLLYDYVLGALLSSAPPPPQRPQGRGRRDEVRQEWRMVWGRVDGLDPRMELWGDYYEGIRRQLETEVDAVLILRSRGGGGGGIQQQQQGGADDDDDEDEAESEPEGDEVGGDSNRSLDRLTHPDSRMSRPAPLGVRAGTSAARG
ncbi:hypothetical protein PG984_010338 [Apiospora sp. TS-2023a]